MSAGSSVGAAGASNVGATPYNGVQAPNKGAQVLLQRLAAVPLRVLAEALGRDESSVCRLRSGETRLTVQEALQLVAALGMKVVDANAVCVRRERYEAMAEIAQAAMASPVISQQLIWDDAA